MDYRTCTLDNGLRIILLPSRSQVVCCGYAIAAGTRQEGENEHGMAHFCEHLTFKGTHRRSALQILNTIETVGGELNAFTNKEHTVYYSMVMNSHLPKAVDLLTDIVFASTYPQTEIDKEVEVVCDEIESYNDSPAELIYDEFENLLFKGHPLGHNILGEAEQLHRYTTEDVKRFAQKHYRPENAVFFVQAPDFQTPTTSHSSREKSLNNIVRLLEKAFKKIYISSLLHPSSFLLHPSSSHLSPWEETEGRVYSFHRGTHQAHVMMGCRAFDMHDKRRIALFLINNILGGPAMNSRLNLALRERRGLVYTVESSMATYSDTGLWATYFGCDVNDVDRCRRLVRHELDRLMRRPLGERQLRAAKRQLKGQLSIAADNQENFTIDVAKNFLHGGWEQDIDVLLARIDALTADDIQQTALALFPEERIITLLYQ